MENPSDVAEKIAALGSMDAVKESGAFDELRGFIDRGEIQLDGKTSSSHRSSAPDWNAA